MYKASLLLTCLLAFASAGVAQQPAPPPRTPSPAVQQLPDFIRNMTPEQRTRVRERLHAILEERRAREQRAAPTPEQPSLGGWVYGPSAVVPPGPIFSESPVGDGGGGVSINGNPYGWTRDIGKPNLNLNLNLDLNLDLNLEGLSQPIATPNPPTVLHAPSVRDTEGVTALAASHQKTPDIRTLDDDLPKSQRLIVRSNPKGYYVGSLDSNDKGGVFRVESVHTYKSKKTGKDVCWARGYAFGDVNLADVWVNCDGLSEIGKNVPAPRRAKDSEIPDPGSESARYLEDRFASLIGPVTTGEKKDAKDYVVVTQDTSLYGNYPLERPANPDGSKPPPGEFSDDLGVVIRAAPCYAFKVRYFSNDGNAVVGKYVRVDPHGETVESRWGILPTANIALPLREGQVPCKQ